jgi:hypothetical protein
MPSFSLCSLQPTTFRIALFTLKMTFDPISYVYVPTSLRSKSTKSSHKIAKHISTSYKTI